MTAGPIAWEAEVASVAPHWAGAFDHVRAELHQEFDGSLPSETVDRCFSAEVAKFYDARITTYLPILIRRNARARLCAIQARPLRTAELLDTSGLLDTSELQRVQD